MNDQFQTWWLMSLIYQGDYLNTNLKLSWLKYTQGTLYDLLLRDGEGEGGLMTNSIESIAHDPRATSSSEETCLQ